MKLERELRQKQQEEAEKLRIASEKEKGPLDIIDEKVLKELHEGSISVPSQAR